MQMTALFFWYVTQRRLVFSHRRFGTTLEMLSRNFGRHLLTMRPMTSPRKSVPNYQSTLCNVPEKRRPPLLTDFLQPVTRSPCVNLERPMVRNAKLDHNCELPETECEGHKTQTDRQTDRQTDHKADSTQAEISSATNRYIIAGW